MPAFPAFLELAYPLMSRNFGVGGLEMNEGREMPVACQKRLGSMNVNKCQQPTKFVLLFRLLFIALVAGILMTLFALN